MTTSVFITVDTELSLAQHQAGISAEDNLQSSIFGRCSHGVYGVGHQMDRLDAYGLKAVYYVDPLPALAYGIDIISRIIEPILTRGHDVQLHMHTEWLEFIETQPVGELRGRNIGDFPLDAQIELLGLARDLLVKAGAPQPVAFRAGNYGANDDTLRALAAVGILHDSSFNPAYIGNGCDISLPQSQTAPIQKLHITEWPVSAIYDQGTNLRHAQLCALSASEMQSGLNHAAATKADAFTIVTHSFELLSRDRARPNNAVVKRFDQMCAAIADNSDLTTETFLTLPAFSSVAHNGERLAPSLIRSAGRMIEQAAAHWRYERG